MLIGKQNSIHYFKKKKFCKKKSKKKALNFNITKLVHTVFAKKYKNKSGEIRIILHTQ